MGKLFSAAEMALASIRRCQSIAPFEPAAEPWKQSIALEGLDRLLSQLFGTEDIEAAYVRRQPVSLTTAASYSLDALLSDDLQFITEVVIADATTGSEEALPLIAKSEYDAIEKKADTGTPERVYITKDDTPTLWVHPVPTAAGLFTLYLNGYRFSPNVANDGREAHLLPEAWQRWLDYQLAYDLGCGPLLHSPQGDKDRWKNEAAEARKGLMSYQNRAHRRRPRFTRPWGP